MIKLILLLILQLEPVSLEINGVDVGALGKLEYYYVNRVVIVKDDYIFMDGFEL